MTDPDFTVEKYSGRWYEMGSDLHVYGTTDCITAEYYELPNNYISANNRGFNLKTQSRGRWTDKIEDGFVAECSSLQPGKCGVTPKKWIPMSPYSVVASDYSNYAIVYGCTNYFGGAIIREDIWLLTREPISTLSEKWSEYFNELSVIITEKLPFFDQTRILRTI